MPVPVEVRDVGLRGATVIGSHEPPDLGVGHCPREEQQLLLLLSHLHPQCNFFILLFSCSTLSCIVFIEIFSRQYI